MSNDDMRSVPWSGFDDELCDGCDQLRGQLDATRAELTALRKLRDDLQHRLDILAQVFDMAVKGDREALARPERLAAYARGASAVEAMGFKNKEATT